MRKILPIALICFLLLSGCGYFMRESDEEYLSEILELPLSEYQRKELQDNHSGFLGDGMMTAVYAFVPADADHLLEQILLNAHWHSLPMSQNLNLVLYGGTRDGVYYVYNLASKAGFPKVENGYWFFYDEQGQGEDCYYDKNLFERGSFNIKCAIFDTDTQTLYYLEFDT